MSIKFQHTFNRPLFFWINIAKMEMYSFTVWLAKVEAQLLWPLIYLKNTNIPWKLL